MDGLHYFIIFSGLSLLGVVFTAAISKIIGQRKNSDARSAHIAQLIREGAMTFLQQEYSILAIVIAIAFVTLTIAFNIVAAVAYTCGALSSMLAGFIGMKAATRANEATTIAAK